MTTEETQNLREDIAFMRALADEGVRPPLLIGPMLMLAGGLFGGASLFSWAAYRFFTVPQWVQPAVYVGLMIVFMAAIPLFQRSLKNKPGYGSPANKAAGQAWRGIGWGIFAFIGAMFIACWKLNSGAPALMIPSVVLVLYGAGWTVAAAMAKQRFLSMIAAACYAFAVISAFLVGSVDILLLFAVVLLLVAFIPGYVLWSREPKDII